MSQITAYFTNSGPGGFIQYLTPDTGGPQFPTAGNINIFGGTGINTVGTVSEITINLDGSVATSYVTDAGTAIPALNILNVVGAGGITTAGSGNTITIDGSAIAVTLMGNTGTASGAIINVVGSTTEGTARTAGNNVSTLTLNFTDADFNVVLGTTAFSATHTPGVGTANVGIGWHALNAVTDGSGNTALGFDAVTSVTTGIQNIGIGVNALNSLMTGSNHIAIGAGMNSIVAGFSNIAIGGTSGSTYTTTESYNILLNNIGVIGESNKMRLGTSGGGPNQVNACYVAGVDGVNVGSTAKVVTMGTGGTVDQLGTATITAGMGITVTPGANTITISSIGSGLTWSVITANQTAAVENGYFCNKAGTLALALPATSIVGDVIEVTNENTALGVQFTQAAGQQILIGNTNTTLGATGTLASSAVGDTLKIVCKVANTIWRVTSVVGNWTPA